jgi:hypothetical protein
VRAEVEKDVGGDEPLLPGHALERHRQQAAERAAGTVCADQPRRVVLLLAVARRGGRPDLVRVLIQGGDRRPPPDRRVGKRLQPLEHDPAQCVLAEVDVVRERSLIGQHVERVGEHLAGGMDAVSVVVLAEAASVDLREQVQSLEVLEQGPVIDDRPG